MHRLVPVAVCVALLAAACGQGAPSKERAAERDWRTVANGVCERRMPEVARSMASAVPTTDDFRLVALYQASLRMLARVRAVDEELARSVAPTDPPAAFRRLLRLRTDVLDLGAAATRSLLASGAPARSDRAMAALERSSSERDLRRAMRLMEVAMPLDDPSLGRLDRLAQRADGLARELGLDACIPPDEPTGGSFVAPVG